MPVRYLIAAAGAADIAALLLGVMLIGSVVLVVMFFYDVIMTYEEFITSPGESLTPYDLEEAMNRPGYYLTVERKNRKLSVKRE